MLVSVLAWLLLVGACVVPAVIAYALALALPRGAWLIPSILGVGLLVYTLASSSIIESLASADCGDRSDCRQSASFGYAIGWIALAVTGAASAIGSYRQRAARSASGWARMPASPRTHGAS